MLNIIQYDGFSHAYNFPPFSPASTRRAPKAALLVPTKLSSIHKKQSSQNPSTRRTSGVIFPRKVEYNSHKYPAIRDLNSNGSCTPGFATSMSSMPKRNLYNYASPLTFGNIKSSSSRIPVLKRTRSRVISRTSINMRSQNHVANIGNRPKLQISQVKSRQCSVQHRKTCFESVPVFPFIQKKVDFHASLRQTARSNRIQINLVGINDHKNSDSSVQFTYWVRLSVAVIFLFVLIFFIGFFSS
ncbi:uncharacterized protein V1516DRAFT_669790 [Lipomyces oligophaga]|uniref:uncharacterized protein n=1 Tax=Lipomyces oligophaga TaxID=45792 RepID=UPI0034CFF41B